MCPWNTLHVPWTEGVHHSPMATTAAAETARAPRVTPSRLRVRGRAVGPAGLLRHASAASRTTMHGSQMINAAFASA